MIFAQDYGLRIALDSLMLEHWNFPSIRALDLEVWGRMAR
jgi:hypothetical protein